MMKNIVNICLISFIVIHMVNGDVGRQNRRVKRLGNPNSRNISNKFKKEIWKEDIADQFQIAPSTQGIQDVNLKCGSNSMFVNLKTESDFTGVIYTKGNFYDQSEPCFVKSKQNRATRSLSMRFNFDQCNTKHDGDVFTNVVVVQNDPELVTPGDAAFALSCDFRKPRSLNVDANYQTNSDRMASGARITLTSPDPSSKIAHQDTEHENTIFSNTDTVTFNAHEMLMSLNDASSVSITSNLIESNNDDNKQHAKVTIDSVDPYSNIDDIESGDRMTSNQNKHQNDEL